MDVKAEQYENTFELARKHTDEHSVPTVISVRLVQLRNAEPPILVHTGNDAVVMLSHM